MGRRKQYMILLIVVVMLVSCQTSSVEIEKNLPSSSGEGQEQPSATPKMPDSTSEIEAVEPIENTSTLRRGDDVLISRAISDLTRRLSVMEDEIQVVSVEAVEWPDSSLGCPVEGRDYAQVITPGYEILLQVGENIYRYHSDKEQFMLLCAEDGTPEMLEIPIQPGDKIQDDSPWMPVD
jgi:hypothetical protein